MAEKQEKGIYLNSCHVSAMSAIPQDNQVTKAM